MRGGADTELWSIDADGSNHVKVLDDATGPAWAPSRLTFAYQMDDDASVENGIYLAAPDGSSTQKLTDDAENSDLEWSPDGKQLVFLDLDYKLSFYGVESGNVSTTTRTGHNPAWSGGPIGPYPEAVLYTAETDPDWSINAMNPANGNIVPWGFTLLGKSAGQHVHPDVHTGTNRVVFAYNDTDNALYDLFLYDPASDTLTRLTNTPNTNEVWPTFSPDGTRIAFISHPGIYGDHNLFVIDDDGSNRTQVTQLSGSRLKFPDWS
ncbi:MAG: hypothetical protein R3290_12910 [Acidimicrobiia bacterium]|nr:hypothetical protein [Acidimicrobiia bacterium]